jgi:hypothetical protein
MEASGHLHSHRYETGWVLGSIIYIRRFLLGLLWKLQTAVSALTDMSAQHQSGCYNWYPYYMRQICEHRYKRCRIDIQLHPNNMNRNVGFCLSKSWSSSSAPSRNLRNMTPVPATRSTLGSTCREATVRWCLPDVSSFLNAPSTPQTFDLTSNKHPFILVGCILLSYLYGCGKLTSFSVQTVYAI